MPNSAEAVVKELMRESMRLPDYLGNAATRKYTMELIADAITRYAAEQVKATWEEMTPYLHHLNGCGCQAECRGQQDHVCNCGLSDLRLKDFCLEG